MFSRQTVEKMAGLVGVKFGDRTVRVKQRDLCTATLGMIFKLDPNSIYITREPEGELFIADDAGRFHVNEIGAEFHVHGDDIGIQPSPTPSTSTNMNLAGGSMSGGRTRFNPPPTPKRPRFSSPTSAASQFWKKAFIFIEVDEKGDFKEKYQLHLLKDETASVPEIKTMLKDQLGFDVTLLDSKHLPILSSELTKGKSFF